MGWGDRDHQRPKQSPAHVCVLEERVRALERGLHIARGIIHREFEMNKDSLIVIDNLLKKP